MNPVETILRNSRDNPDCPSIRVHFADEPKGKSPYLVYIQVVHVSKL